MRPWLLAALCGCGGLTPLADYATEGGAAGTVTPDGGPGDLASGPDAGADASRDLSCADVVAYGNVPETITGTTAGAGDDLSTSCGANQGAEVTVAYVAPVTGDYVFDLANSSFDTTLALKSDCGDAELACNDDWLPDSLSQVVVSLSEGDTVLAVVEGRGASNGAFELNVDLLQDSEVDCFDGRDLDHDQAVDCVDSDCSDDPACALPCADAVISGALPIETSASTVGMGNQTDPSCASTSSAPDLAVQFTAPSAGSYTFETAGSDFDTVLYARPSCFGAELACNDDAAGLGRQSRIVLTLAAGETIVVIVDGYGSNSGNVTLGIY